MTRTFIDGPYENPHPCEPRKGAAPGTTNTIGAAVEIGGVVYGFQNSTGNIVTIDVANGNYTVVGTFDPSAGILVGAASVPEPASLALAVMGLAAIGITGLRRRLRL